MKEQEIKEKVQKAQDDYFEAILIFFEKDKNQSYTASKIVSKLGVFPGHKDWFSHSVLRALTEQGKLEKCEPRKGFKYRDKE